MKKLQVLAAMLSTVAIAGSVAFGATSAQACFYSQSLNQPDSTTSLPGSGSDKMNPWKANRGAIGFGLLAVILGVGAGYMSYRAGQEVKAACAAMGENFDIDAPEEVADELREHPEAPGGELDLISESASEVGIEVAEKEEVLAK